MSKLLAYHSLNATNSNAATSGSPLSSVFPQREALRARLSKVYEQHKRAEQREAGGSRRSSSSTRPPPRNKSNRSRVIDDSSDSDADAETVTGARRDESKPAPLPAALSDPDPADFEADEEAADECDCPRQLPADSDGDPTSDAGAEEAEEILDVRALLESAGHFGSNSAEATASSSSAGESGSQIGLTISCF